MSVRILGADMAERHSARFESPTFSVRPTEPCVICGASGSNCREHHVAPAKSAAAKAKEAAAAGAPDVAPGAPKEDEIAPPPTEINEPSDGVVLNVGEPLAAKHFNRVGNIYTPKDTVYAKFFFPGTKRPAFKSLVNKGIPLTGEYLDRVNETQGLTSSFAVVGKQYSAENPAGDSKKVEEPEAPVMEQPVAPVTTPSNVDGLETK